MKNQPGRRSSHRLRMRGAVTFLAVGMAISLAIGGCAALPTSGEPQSFAVSRRPAQPIDQTGFGPQADSSPEQIISDFLRACAAGADDDYATAREYLLPDAASGWRSGAGVLIYPADEELQITAAKVPADIEDPSATKKATGDPSQVQLVLGTRVIGQVDQSGILTDTADTTAQVEFTLVKTPDEQWRISALDDGIVLSQYAFLSAYQSANLYFLTVDQESLVADPRWFPRKRLTSHLVQGLLAGPSDQLRSSVYSTLNDSLRLPTQGVETEGQIARVRLVGELAQGERTREKLSWQLTATLEQVVGVRQVEIEVNSVLLEPTPSPFGPAYELDVAVGIEDGSIVTGEGDVWERLVPAEEAGQAASNPARGPISDPTVAWLNGDSQLRIWSRGSIVRAFDFETVAPPSVDRWGWVWTATGQAGKITVIGPDSGKQELSLSGRTEAVVTKALVSSDGVRLLLLGAKGDSQLVATAIIRRDERGAPVGIDRIEPVPQAGEGVLDIAWAAPGTIVILSRTTDGTELTIAPLGSFSQTVKAQPGAVRLAAAPVAGRIYLQTDDDRVFMRVASLWREVDTSVSDINFPG